MTTSTGIGVGRRDEIGGAVAAARKRRAQARDVEPLGYEIVVQMVALGFIDGRIELDQHVAGLDALSVLHADRAHHAGLERLYHLAASARNHLAGR